MFIIIIIIIIIIQSTEIWHKSYLLDDGRNRLEHVEHAKASCVFYQSCVDWALNDINVKSLFLATRKAVNFIHGFVQHDSENVAPNRTPCKWPLWL
jgi:hypothetical protein